jgi:hypothetical protein
MLDLHHTEVIHSSVVDWIKPIMSEKISDKLKPFYDGYALNPPKNSDHRVLSGICLVYLPFMISTAQPYCSLVTYPISVCQKTAGLRYQNHK